MLFVSTVISIVQVPEVGVLQTALTLLDRVLLIFIFVELLDTIGIVIREREIFACPSPPRGTQEESPYRAVRYGLKPCVTLTLLSSRY